MTSFPLGVMRVEVFDEYFIFIILRLGVDCKGGILRGQKSDIRSAEFQGVTVGDIFK